MSQRLNAAERYEKSAKSRRIMAAPPNAETSPGSATGDDDQAGKAVQKEYERLTMVRSKAMKGKGAWYWAHLEPLLLPNPETGSPKAVKLRCSLCNAVFSASNPSRTASEHLKRGTCPNFSSSSSELIARAALPRPISSVQSYHHHRKRSAHQISPLAIMEPLDAQPRHLLTSGGKEDLGALALLEDSVNRLKSPKTSLCPSLSKTQVESATSLLAEWVYQCGGAVPFSAVDHPKFRAFLQQVGIPGVSRCELAGSLLETKYEEARLQSEEKIRDALFFQLAARWRDGAVVSLAVNLPNGASVFRRAHFTQGKAPPKYAEEILRQTLAGVSNISGGGPDRCAGVVADRFNSSALRELESRNKWMVNLVCQLKAFRGLLKDIVRELPLFRSIAGGVSKAAHFFNSNSRARSIFQKYQLQGRGQSSLLRESNLWELDLEILILMLEDVSSSTRALQMAVADDSYKVVCAEDTEATQIAEMIQEESFWDNLTAILALVKIVKGMAQEMEIERPFVGQCLPLWDEIKSKLKHWCEKFKVDGATVESILERRFKKSYHPAWSASFILDPLYLAKEASGKYLPQFKRLSSEQERDVDKLITRLVSPEEAPTVLMELMKWRTEGLDPLYAQAVQLKQRDPLTGKMRIANPQSRRLVWETCLSEFALLGRVAVRLIFMQATTSGFRVNESLLRWVSASGRSPAAMDRARKLVFVAAQAKLERRDFSTEEDGNADLFATGEDDALHEVLADSS